MGGAIQRGVGAGGSELHLPTNFFFSYDLIKVSLKKKNQ
jgi:hypothetical protein